MRIIYIFLMILFLFTSIFAQSNNNYLIYSIIRETPEIILNNDPDVKKTQKYIDISNSIDFNPIYYDNDKYNIIWDNYSQHSYYLGKIRGRLNLIRDIKIKIKSEMNEIDANEQQRMINEINKMDQHTSKNYYPDEKYFDLPFKNIKTEYTHQLEFMDRLYNLYFAKYKQLALNGSYIWGKIVQYNTYRLGKTEQEMLNLLNSIDKIQNQGIADAGGMSQNELKIRKFALNFLMPIFSSASKGNVAGSSAEAAFQVLALLANVEVGYEGIISIYEMPEEFFGKWFTTDGNDVWALGIKKDAFRVGNKFWEYKEITNLGYYYKVMIKNENKNRTYFFKDIGKKYMKCSSGNDKNYKLYKKK